MDLIALYENGNYSEACESATRFLAMYPNDGFGWKLRGAVLSRVGNLHEALDANKQATIHSPNDPEVHNSLGLHSISLDASN